MEPVDALRRGRDRILADPRFQRAAIAFAPTRPIAQRRAALLFDLCAGFVYSQVVQACVTLRLPQRVAAAPMSAAALALDLALPSDRLELLLDAAAAIGLLEHRSASRYGLGMHGAALLANPGVVAMVEHHRLLYADLTDPVAVVAMAREHAGAAASPGTGAFWPYAGHRAPADLPAQSVRPYCDLMAASQQFIAELVLAAYRFDRHAHLLDVGGGDGSFAIATAERAPKLAVTVFDLPAVATIARRHLEATGFASRATCVGGDFLRDPLPPGADLATLVRVLHDHEDAQALRLLTAIHAALQPGGTLLIAEPVAGDQGAGRRAACYFSVYLMAMGSGRPRTRRQIRHMVEQAGFGNVRWRTTRNPLLASVMTATRR